MEPMTGLWQAYRAGGFLMHPITVCSVLAVGAIVHQFVVFRRIRMDQGEFIATIRKALLNGRMQEAVEACGRHPGPIARTLMAGLLRHGAPKEEIDRAMEAVALHELARLERFLPLLATVVVLAPMLGFLGTVVGLILTFEAASAQGLSDAGQVAHGISVALYTTAWGLVVAFMALPFQHYFVGRVARCARDIETAAGILFDTFAEMDRMGTRA